MCKIIKIVGKVGNEPNELSVAAPSLIDNLLSPLFAAPVVPLPLPFVRAFANHCGSWD